MSTLSYSAKLNAYNNQINNFNQKEFDTDFMISQFDGNTNIAGDGKAVDFFFNQETPYKFPPLIICDDSKRNNQNIDIYQKYSDVIMDECGNRFNIRNLRDSAGLLQKGYSTNIDLDSHLKNINFYNDKCYYDNWKMAPKISQDPCDPLKRNSKLLVPDYTAVGKHYGDCIGNCSSNTSNASPTCNNTPPTDINCETDVRKRYDFSHNKFQTESCIKPSDFVSFKRAPVPDVGNLGLYPSEKRNLKLLDTVNNGIQHDYYKFFDNTKCIVYPQQRLFNNITKANCLPNNHFRGDIGPKYLA